MSGPFWADAFTEPKRKYKFLFSIAGFDDNSAIEPFLVKTVKKPSWEVGEAEHQFLNHTFYYPGKVKWSEMEVTIVDPSNVHQRLMRLLIGCGYPLPRGAETLDSDSESTLSFDQATATSVSKARGVGALGLVTLSQIVPANPNPIKKPGQGDPLPNQFDVFGEKWKLHNAWLKNVDFGDLSYEDEGMSEISLTLRYDWATLANHKAVGPGTSTQ